MTVCDARSTTYTGADCSHSNPARRESSVIEQRKADTPGLPLKAEQSQIVGVAFLINLFGKGCRGQAGKRLPSERGLKEVLLVKLFFQEKVVPKGAVIPPALPG